MVAVVKTHTKYTLKLDDYLITARMYHCGQNKGKITLETDDNNDIFEFVHSSPKTIKAIAELMLEATKIADNYFA